MAENANVTEEVKDGKVIVEETEKHEDFTEKFEKILDSKFDKVAKSILKANGIEKDAEVEELITAYHQRKQENTKTITDELENLRKENENLKAEKFQNELENAIKSSASKLGFNEKYTNQIIKLAKLDGVRNTEGKLDNSKLENAINEVLKECDAFKISEKDNNETKIITIGAGQVENPNNGRNENVSLAQLMKMHNTK